MHAQFFHLWRLILGLTLWASRMLSTFTHYAYNSTDQHLVRSWLPFCEENPVAHRTLSCDKVVGAARGLCLGAQEVQRANCEQLGEVAFVRAIVERVGLTPDSRGAALYGDEAAKKMVVAPSRAARKKVGLWQNPQQIAAALVHIGSRVEVHRYIEVGVYTAWTCCFVSTYLRRVGKLGSFEGYAVDLSSAAIAVGTKTLLASLNVTFLYRSLLKLPPAVPYDFCFIDGDHAYDGIKRDYRSFSPACRFMMFHDIQDISTVHLKNFSGGVPLFWAHLTAATHHQRRTEFIHLPAEVRYPSFGLGVLGPTADGTCGPDTPFEHWPDWTDGVSGDSTAVPVWRELCRYNRTRLCRLGAQGILDGQNPKHHHARRQSPDNSSVDDSDHRISERNWYRNM